MSVKQWMVLVAIVLSAVVVSAEESLTLKTEKDKIHYGIGAMTVRNLKQQGIELDMEIVIQGMKDEFAGKPLLITEGELRRTVSMVQAEAKQKRMQMMNKGVKEKNAKKADGPAPIDTGIQKQESAAEQSLPVK